VSQANRLLRLKQVVLKVGLSRSQIYKLIARGLFPEQTKIGPKISVWPEHAIDQWISRQIEGGVQ
jgi:prophage regulatory protein